MSMDDYEGIKHVLNYIDQDFDDFIRQNPLLFTLWSIQYKEKNGKKVAYQPIQKIEKLDDRHFKMYFKSYLDIKDSDHPLIVNGSFHFNYLPPYREDGSGEFDEASYKHSALYIDSVELDFADENNASLDPVQMQQSVNEIHSAVQSLENLKFKKCASDNENNCSRILRELGFYKFTHLDDLKLIRYVNSTFMKDIPYPQEEAIRLAYADFFKQFVLANHHLFEGQYAQKYAALLLHLLEKHHFEAEAASVSEYLKSHFAGEVLP